MYNFSFKGRATRTEYWTFYFINLAILFIGGFLVGALESKILAYVFGFWILVWFVAALAMGWRRCHDLNKPGYLTLAMCIPYLGFLVWLYVGFGSSYPGVTEYED